MRKALLAAAILLAGVLCQAQPRTAGIRLGITSMEASYQHTLGLHTFLQTEIGLDLHNIPGFKATGTYNVIFASPDFTETGSWNMYAGAGLSIGYVNDVVHYEDHWPDDMGAMAGITVQLGAEYNFDFPLQISVDLRPTFGRHLNGGFTTTEGIRYKGKTEFFNYGLYGLIPTFSARYIF